MRVFFCLTIPKDLRRTIGSTAGRLRERTRMRASWVQQANYHVTVRFLGEIDPATTVDLDRICRDVARAFDPFEIRLDCVGAFPNAERPRVLWVGGETPPVFVELVHALNDRLTAIGFERERKRAVAHVTVARVKGRPDPDLGRVLANMDGLPTMSAPVDRVTLMESRLTPDGAVYTPLFEARLGV